MTPLSLHSVLVSPEGFLSRVGMSAVQGGGSTDKVPFANWRVNRWHGQHSRSLWTWVYHSPGSHLVVFSPLTHSLAYFLGTILPLLFTLLNLKQKLGLKPFRKRTKPVRFSANPFNLCWSPNHAVLSCGEIFSYCLMHRNPFPLSFCFQSCAETQHWCRIMGSGNWTPLPFWSSPQNCNQWSNKY